MNSTKLTGNVYQGGAFQGSPKVAHTYIVNYNTNNIANGVQVDTISASVDRPVQVEVSANVVTAFNAASSNVLTAGTSSTATEWLGGSDITEGNPGYYPASNAVKKFRLTTDTPIWVKYTQSGSAQATGTLTSDATAPSDGDTVTIGTKVYTYKTTLTPTEGQVLINGGADPALLNLIRAINHSGTPGTDYFVAAANTQVTAATSVTSHAFAVTAIVAGTAANSIATTETSSHLSWGATTLTGGVDSATTGQATIIVQEYSENTLPIS